MAHNAQDGRCRYTLGNRRCPAPGHVQVGRWWVCELHRYWADNPADADRAADGRDALEVQERTFGRLREEALQACGGAEAAEAPARPTPTRDERARETAAEALAQARQATGTQQEPGWQRWLHARELAVPFYRQRRRQLQGEGYEAQAAHEAALGDLAEEIVRRIG